MKFGKVFLKSWSPLFPPRTIHIIMFSSFRIEPMIFGGRMAKLLELIILLSVYLPSNQQQNLAFQSFIQLTPFGTKFQPRNSIELLDTYTNIRSLLQCSMPCNQNRQCRTFDYDQSTLICRLFEGEFSTGTILYNSTSLTSRIGAIIYNTTIIPDLYSSYNRTCNQCSTDENRYLQCINGTCQCPIHTYWNSQICSNQLYNGSNCSSWTLSCRQDLNLTCSTRTNSCVVSSSGMIFIFIRNEWEKWILAIYQCLCVFF
jgi:hypothetical protein